MTALALLAAAILAEVTGTLALRAAATGRTALYGVTAVGYLTSFVLLSLALSEGLGIGVAYGIWAASGVALTAVAARVLWRDPLTPTMLAGIGLIMCGVLLVELGAH